MKHILQQTSIKCCEEDCETSKVQTVFVVEFCGNIADNDHHHGQPDRHRDLQEGCRHCEHEEIGNVEQAARHGRQFVISPIKQSTRLLDSFVF